MLQKTFMNKYNGFTALVHQSKMILVTFVSLAVTICFFVNQLNNNIQLECNVPRIWLQHVCQDSAISVCCLRQPTVVGRAPTASVKPGTHHTLCWSICVCFSSSLVVHSDQQCASPADVLDCYCDFAVARCARGCNSYAMGHCEQLCQDYNGVARCDCDTYNQGGSTFLF